MNYNKVTLILVDYFIKLEIAVALQKLVLQIYIIFVQYADKNLVTVQTSVHLYMQCYRFFYSV